MSVRPARRATEALLEYLSSSSHGLAVALAAIRSDESLTTALLPDPAQIAATQHRRERATSYPAVEIEPSRVGSDEGANQRLYPVTLSVTCCLPSSVVQGDQEDLISAGWDYIDAIASCLQRRTPKGEQGNTLANGGTGAGLGRIVRATLASGQVLVDDDQIQRVFARCEITVTVAEDY